MTEPRWDDDRLRRAYADQFDRPAPAGLATATATNVRADRGRRRKHFAPAWAAAVAAVLVLSVGIGLVAVRQATQPPPTPSAPPTTQTPTPDGDAFPNEVLGLPVISVSEAIARRDAGPDDTEIAVRGYMPPPPPLPPSCPPTVQRPSPLEPFCPDHLISWLTERPETIWRAVPNGQEAGPPAGPALQPMIGPEVPRAILGDEPDGAAPLPVVLVGHFDDLRAGLCPDDAGHECRRRFVVDARVWVDGREAGREAVLPNGTTEPIRSVEEVIAIAAGTVTMLADPWVALLGRDQVRDVDPRVADVPFLRDGKYVWVVRHLAEEAGRVVARTSFIVNNSGALFAARAEGIESTVATIPDPSHAPFPADVFGIPVWTVEEAMAGHDSGTLNDRAVAVSGYFLVPPPAIACAGVREDVEPVPPFDRSCPEFGRLWLMNEPEQPWAFVDGTRRWRRPLEPTLNLTVRPEVPFNRQTAFDPARDPAVEPVVVLGHFGDSLVVDALVWADGRTEPDDIHYLDLINVEDRAVVEARIDAHLGPPVASWATVLSGTRLAEFLPDVSSTELESAGLVWRIRRLVTERGAPYIRTAYTVDGGTRVWIEEPYAGLSLQPTHSIALRSGVRFEVTDGPDLVTDVRLAEGADPSGAIVTAGSESHPSLTLSNPGGDLRQLRVSWTGTRCETRWDFSLWWLETNSGAVPRSIYLGYRDERCPDSDVRHSVILTLSEPMPAGEVFVNDVVSGG